MNELNTVLLAVLPVLCLVGAGAVMRLLNWLSAESDQSLLRVTINVLTPCLILNSILGNDALKDPRNVLVPPVLGFAFLSGGILLARLFLRPTGLVDPRERRTFAFTVGVFNYGYVPLPLALALFDRETVGVLFVFILGVEAAIWTVGLAALRGEGIWRHARRLVNPPLMAIAAALILNVSSLDRHLPGFVLDTGRVFMTAIQMLGQCAIPLALVLIGATIADHRKAFHPTRGGRVMGMACLIRLVLLPILFLVTAKYLPLSLEMKRVIVLEAAMPAAVFPIVMTRHYGGDTSTALRVVIVTSLVGFATMPWWIRFGMRYLGL